MSDDVDSGEEALRRSGHVSTASDRASASSICGRQAYFAALEHALQTSLNAIVRIESATIYSKLSSDTRSRSEQQCSLQRRLGFLQRKSCRFLLVARMHSVAFPGVGL